MHSQNRDLLFFALAVLLAVTAGSLATIVPLPIAVLCLIVPSFAVLFLVNLRTMLLVLLVARSSIDVLHGMQVASTGDVDLNAAALLGVALVLLGVYYIFANRVNLFSSPVVLPYAAFLAICLVGLLVSRYPMQTFSDWLRLASILVFYVLVLDAFRSQADIGKILVAYFLSSVIPVLLGTYQLITDQGVNVDGFNRVFGTFVVPPVFAFYLVGLFPVICVVVIHSTNRLIKLLMAAWLILVLINLVSTYTRAAWIGALIAIAVMALVRHRKLLIVMPVLALALVMLFPQITERFADLNETRSRTGYGEANTLAWRTKFWLDILENSAQSSPLVGSGLGFVKRTLFVDPHNDYLRLYVETGILGFVAYAATLVALFATSLRSYKRAISIYQKDLSLAFIAVLMAYMTMSITDNIILGPVIQWYFWTQAAVVHLVLTSSANESKSASEGGRVLLPLPRLSKVSAPKTIWS